VNAASGVFEQRWADDADSMLSEQPRLRLGVDRADVGAIERAPPHAEAGIELEIAAVAQLPDAARQLARGELQAHVIVVAAAGMLMSQP
jgi:hypothetical protein